MQRKAPLAIGEFYHLYNRGTDKRVIFNNEEDRKRFLLLLYVSNGTNAVNITRTCKGHKGRSFAFAELTQHVHRGDSLTDIGAYCLMPNHFHILVREKIDGGITKFMSKLTTAYSMYFNKKYERSGNLFEGRFKSSHVSDDVYLKYLFAYIHLNPVKIIDPMWKENGISNKRKAKEYLEDYIYSSYNDYIHKNRAESIVLTTQSFPKYFSKSRKFTDFIDEWLSFNNAGKEMQKNK